ncbi:hypothetical protein O3P69_017642 [Scylla paramamosain]|uniref:Uncharacterized protein n=1 Tax=Scylla paramamosain TaxID=85552 RepID=A0AAW0TXL0_SCYPA
MDQERDIAAAVRAVTVAVLNQDGSVVMDEETVTTAAAEDPEYQLLISKSNSRAEAAIKAAKRLLRSNTGPGGSLDNDRASKALLQYLNTPLRDGDKSPAQLATGRQLRDRVLVARQHYKIDQHWMRNLRQRERAMVKAQDEVPLVRGGVQCSLPPWEPDMQVRVQDAGS